MVSEYSQEYKTGFEHGRDVGIATARLELVNDNLIAAAPELLAALKALVTEVGEHAIDSGHTFRTLDQARKAIEAAS